MKKWIIVILLLFLVAGGAFILADHPQGKIEKTERFNDSIEDFRYYAVNRAKVEGIDLLLNGQSLKNFSYDIRMDDHMKLLCPERFLEDIMGCGLWAGRLMFTTESPRECVMVTKAYQGQSDYRPNGLTRGLYYRGVE